MAGETTTTTVEELVYSEWICPVMQAHLAENDSPSFSGLDVGPPQNGANTVRVVRPVSDAGAVGDHGTYVDTEYNMTEATAISAVAFDTEEGTISLGKYGVFREVSSESVEDSINGGEWTSVMMAHDAQIIATAFNSDFTTKFTSVSNTSGTTNTTLGKADIDDALDDIVDRGGKGKIMVVLGLIQKRHFMAALTATNSAAAIYQGTADRVMGVNSYESPDFAANRGLFATYRQADFYMSGLTLLANTNVDEVGCAYLRGDVAQNAPLASFGVSKKRLPRVKMQEDPVKDTLKIVTTARMGVGTIYDSTAQRILTKAS